MAEQHRPFDLRFEERFDGDAYVATMPPSPASTPGFLFGLLFVVFWDAFLVLWYGIVLSEREWSSALFGMIHLAVGIYLTHALLVAIFNVRTLVIGGGRVVFRSGPVPARGVDVAIDDVDRFEVAERKTRRSTSHVVVVALKDGASRRLDVATTEKDHTSFIAACLNEALTQARIAQPRLPAYRA